MNQIQSYLERYKTLTLLELVHELNILDKNDTRFMTLNLLISTMIVDRLSKRFYTSGTDLEMKSSLVASIVQLKIAKDELTIQDIDRESKRELNIISNLAYNTIDTGIVNKEDYYQSDDVNSFIVEKFKRECIKLCPPIMKLSMYYYLNSGQILIDSYSGINKFLFHSTLESMGVKLMDEVPFHNELTSNTEKAIFLTLLCIEYPDLFIVLATTKNINSLIMLSELSNKFPSKLKVLSIIEDLVKKTKISVSNNSINKNIEPLMLKLAKTIIFNKYDYSLVDMLSDSYMDIYELSNKVIDSSTSSLKNRGDNKTASSLLSNEVSKSLNLVSNIIKVTKQK